MPTLFPVRQFYPISHWPLLFLQHTDHDFLMCKEFACRPILEAKLRYLAESKGSYGYKVDFWNHDTATAPAQIVFVEDTIDPNFDLTTFGFANIGFREWNVPLDGAQYFNVNVDMRPTENLTSK